MAIYVIAAFPGTGKSEATKILNDMGVAASDSDSSHHPKEPQGVFPDNYIHHIKSRIKELKQAGGDGYIFVSSHKVVRDALVAEKIDFTLFYPSLALKQIYLNRYIDRGSNEAFVQLLDDNYDDWIDEIQDEEGYSKYMIVGDVYLSDLLTRNL